MLGRGRYSQLPLALESAKPAEPASVDETRGALAWLRAVLRYRCAHWRLPEGVELRQGRGCVLCRLPGEYEVALTTQNPNPHPNPNNPNPNPDPNPDLTLTLTLRGGADHQGERRSLALAPAAAAAARGGPAR